MKLCNTIVKENVGSFVFYANSSLFYEQFSLKIEGMSLISIMELTCMLKFSFAAGYSNYTTICTLQCRLWMVGAS